MARKRLNLREGSRARFSTLYFKGDWEWFGAPDYPDFPESIDDEWVEVKKTTRLDILANEYYDDPTLWYVIALANDLELVPSDMYVGQKLRIPPKSTVTDLLKKARRISS